MTVYYRRYTHDEHGNYRGCQGDKAANYLNDATDGIIHALDDKWHTLSEIITIWDQQYRQDLYRPFLEAPHVVAEWLAVLAAAGIVQVRVEFNGKAVEISEQKAQFVGGVET